MQAVSTVIFLMGAVTLVSAFPARKATLPESTPKSAVQVQCSPHDRMCLSRGQLPYADGHCYTPLERGPCPKSQIVVLDVNNGSALRGSCRAQQCTSGLVPFTRGRCLGLKTASMLLCSGSDLHLDATGYSRCGRFSDWVQGIHKFVRCSEAKRIPFSRSLHMNSSEVIDFTPRLGGAPPRRLEAVRTSGITCAEQNSGNCVTETLGDSPNPVIETEK